VQILLPKQSRKGVSQLKTIGTANTTVIQHLHRTQQNTSNSFLCSEYTA